MSLRPGQPPPLTGWRLARPPVSLGRRTGDLDLTDLRTRATAVAAGAPLEDHLRHVHQACQAVAAVVLAPWVVDGVVLSVEPSRLGVRYRSGVPCGVWVADVEEVAPGARDLGDSCVDLLRPVLDVVARRSGRPRATIRRLAQDRLAGEVERLRRHTLRALDDEDVALMLGAFGVSLRPSRSIGVVADDGSAVTMRVPTTCCVLSTHVGHDACPTCPRRPDEEDRRIATIEWLRSVDDDEFRALTGRDRIVFDGSPTTTVGTPTVAG